MYLSIAFLIDRSTVLHKNGGSSGDSIYQTSTSSLGDSIS